MLKNEAETEENKFMAQTVVEIGFGGQRLVEKELGWNRYSIRKGIKELKSGITCIDNYSAKGRNRAEFKLPLLLSDIKSIVDAQSQTDPSFKSQRLYRRLSAAKVRQQLIEKYNYSDDILPSEETIRVKLNDLGYKLRRVAKIKPQKKYQKQKQYLIN